MVDVFWDTVYIYILAKTGLNFKQVHVTRKRSNRRNESVFWSEQHNNVNNIIADRSYFSHFSTVRSSDRPVNIIQIASSSEHSAIKRGRSSWACSSKWHIFCSRFRYDQIHFWQAM